MRTGMARSRQAVTTRWRRMPGAEGIAMITSSGLTASSTRGRSAVVPSTLWPATRMPCLRGSSSTKPTGALRRPRVAAQLGGDLLAAVAGADDQHLVARPLEHGAAGRPLERPAHREAGAAGEHERQQEVDRDDASRRVVAADREQEQDDDQAGGRDDGRLQDRLEVLLVDEAPQLRVEAERGEDRDLHRDRDPDRVQEQLLVAVRDPLVEAEQVREPVGEREQGRVHTDLADATNVH